MRVTNTNTHDWTTRALYLTILNVLQTYDIMYVYTAHYDFFYTEVSPSTKISFTL